MSLNLGISLIAGVVFEEYIPSCSQWKDTIKLPEITPVSLEMSQRKFDETINHNYIKQILLERPSLDTVDCIYHKLEFKKICNIIGYRIASVDGEFALGLMEIHPEYFNESGYNYCPSIPIEEDTSEEAYIIKNQTPDIPIGMIERVKHKTMLIQNGWNYKNLHIKCHIWH